MNKNNNLELSLNKLFATSGYKMIDVSSKDVTHRKALAMGEIILGSQTIEMIKAKKMPKGDPLSIAEVSGINGVKKTKEHEILSIAQVNEGDFVKLFSSIWSHQNVEINLSCPNISKVGNWSEAGKFLKGPRDWCIAKVSPLITIEEIGYLIDDIGFTQIHFSNTLPLSKFDRFSEIFGNRSSKSHLILVLNSFAVLKQTLLRASSFITFHNRSIEFKFGL